MRKHYVLQKDLFKFQALYSPNETVYFRGFFTSWIRIQKAYLHADPDPKHKKQKHRATKKGSPMSISLWSIKISVAEPELVLFGQSRSRCEDLKAKTLFLLLFSLFLYEKEPEPV